MNKSDIIEEITKCAKLYQENLENRNIMFIYIENKEIKYIETKFLKSNFLHLTGIKSKNISANYFYDKCINQRIKQEDIEIREDGNTQRKISVLSRNMNINKNARMIGSFNQSNVHLYSEKIIGNVYSSLGFVKSQKYYIPNTSLKKDIRKISNHYSKIICILSKKIQEEKYSQITYINKKYEEEIKLRFKAL